MSHLTSSKYVTCFLMAAGNTSFKELQLSPDDYFDMNTVF